MRYDAAIIGAGANGLVAAACLAGAGLSVVVVERSNRAGGRLATREFHPGFRASPFCDEVDPIPADVYRALDLARRGAILLPAQSSLALWPDRRNEIRHDGTSPGRIDERTFADVESLRAHARADALRAPKRRWFARSDPAPAWPQPLWAGASLAEALSERSADPDARAHALARALAGRAVDPFAPGGALHLLTPGLGGSGMTMGGLATLAEALERAAREAGADMLLGLEAADIQRKRGRACGLRLADGTEIGARAIISTLDLKRTFFSLFAWKDLPEELTGRVSAFRHAPSAARLLLALDAPPPGTAELGAGPFFVAPGIKSFARAFDAWRMQVAPELPPMSLRLVSAADPSLAPSGKATMTATIGCVPHRPFDGPWTHDKRMALRRRALAAIESVLPGTAARLLGAELILPEDIESALGVTGGDLDGGEIAPDQMFAWRGFSDRPGGRTPIRGLYLGGRSAPAGPLGACEAGVVAARAALADFAAGRLA